MGCDLMQSPQVTQEWGMLLHGFQRRTFFEAASRLKASCDLEQPWVVIRKLSSVKQILGIAGSREHLWSCPGLMKP